jgi:hypothetical protein
MEVVNMTTSTQPKAKEVELQLPVPTRIGGDVDAMLESTIADKFITISLLHDKEKDIEKGQLVLSHKASEKDPAVRVSTWNTDLGNLSRYISALVNSWSSGVGQSGDGSALYVAKYTDAILKVIPDLAKRDLMLIPNGRAGVAKYRVSVQRMINQVNERATDISSCKDSFGIASSKARTHKEVAKSVVKLV